MTAAPLFAAGRRRIRARPGRRARRLGNALLAVVLLWPLLQLAEFRPAALFEAGNLAVMTGFLAGFMPPDARRNSSACCSRRRWKLWPSPPPASRWRCCLAAPLAVVATRALSVSSMGPGPGRWRGTVLRGGCRALLTVLRAIPEIVWALMFVRVLGLGPTAGVLALAITYGGMLGKVYTEILESTDTRPARALLQSGSGRLTALAYGLIPNAAQELTSYTVYRWECAVRASVIMGFVGAGGLGQLMDQSMKMLNGGEASSILLVFLLLVLLADAISAALRKALA